MFGPALWYARHGIQHHRPPEKSVLVTGENFKTKDGKTGLNAKYYKDIHYRNYLLKELIQILMFSGIPVVLIM